MNAFIGSRLTVCRMLLAGVLVSICSSLTSPLAAQASKARLTGLEFRTRLGMRDVILKMARDGSAPRGPDLWFGCQVGRQSRRRSSG